MEITLEAIISLVGLFIGGTGLTGFFFWRQHKRKEEAEAKLAEAEAKLKEAEVEKAKIEAKKEDQDYYQQLARDLAEDREDRKRQNDELRQERDHYKGERNELRDQLAKLESEVRAWKKTSEDERDGMMRTISRLGRKVDAMAPLMCGRLGCTNRLYVTVNDDGAVSEKRTKKKGKEDE